MSEEPNNDGSATEALVRAIEAELTRLAVTRAEVGELDSIGVNDEDDGWSSLGSSEDRHDFYWYGRLEELLDRLSALPDGAGPTAVREEFRSYFPG